jgi:hypothetical protein
MVKELALKAMTLSVKKKKNPFQKAVLGKTEHLMQYITPTMPHMDHV